VDAATHSPAVLFHYPTREPSGFAYLGRSVKIELGSLTDQRPVGTHRVQPWMAEEFPGPLQEPKTGQAHTGAERVLVLRRINRLFNYF